MHCVADRQRLRHPAPTPFPQGTEVEALVSLSKDTNERAIEAEEKEEAARERKRIVKECAEKVGDISYSPPAILESLRLSGSEIQEIKNACVRELDQDEGTRRVAATIDKFAAFCDLRRKPENHIKVRTGQYVEKEVTIRTEADMVNEMARELVGLPIFMAYARVRQERGGEQALFKGKIRTLQLPFVEVAAAQEAFARNRAKVEENSRRYLKPRDHIRREIAGAAGEMAGDGCRETAGGTGR